MGNVGLTKDPCVPKDRFITVRFQFLVFSLSIRIIIATSYCNHAMHPWRTDIPET